MAETSRRRIWQSLGLAALVIVVLLGWTQRHRFVPLDAGSMMPDYAAPALNGDTVALRDYRGKIVVLNIWATWCPPCIREMPSLERLQHKLGPEGLQVVAVSVDAPIGSNDGLGNPGGDVRAFAQEFNLTFPILLDPAKRIEQRLGIVGLPSTIVLDRAGRILKKKLGAAEWDDSAHVAEFRRWIALSQ